MYSRTANYLYFVCFFFRNMSHDIIFGKLTQSQSPGQLMTEIKELRGAFVFDLRDFSPVSGSVHCLYWLSSRDLTKSVRLVSGWCSAVQSFWKKKNMASNTRPCKLCKCGSSVRRARGGISCCPEPADANVQALCDKVCPDVFSELRPQCVFSLFLVTWMRKINEGAR